MGHPFIRPSFFKAKSIPSAAYADHSIPALALAAGIPTSNDFGSAGILTDKVEQTLIGADNGPIKFSIAIDRVNSVDSDVGNG